MIQYTTHVHHIRYHSSLYLCRLLDQVQGPLMLFLVQGQVLGAKSLESLHVDIKPIITLRIAITKHAFIFPHFRMRVRHSTDTSQIVHRSQVRLKHILHL